MAGWLARRSHKGGLKRGSEESSEFDMTCLDIINKDRELERWSSQSLNILPVKLKATAWFKYIRNCHREGKRRILRLGPTTIYPPMDSRHVISFQDTELNKYTTRQQDGEQDIQLTCGGFGTSFRHYNERRVCYFRYRLLCYSIHHIS
jgi:hypothetical protein